MDDKEAGEPSWKRLEFAGVTALAATLVCLFVGQAAVQYAANTAEPVDQPQKTAKMQPRFNAIEYAETGSVKGAETTTVIIGPCDNHKP